MKEEGALEIPKLRGFGDSLQGNLGVVLQLMPGLVRKFPPEFSRVGDVIEPYQQPCQLTGTKCPVSG